MRKMIRFICRAMALPFLPFAGVGMWAFDRDRRTYRQVLMEGLKLLGYLGTGKEESWKSKSKLAS